MKPNEVYVEIQLFSKQGLSLQRIAAEVGRAVNTVRRHLALEAVPKVQQRQHPAQAMNRVGGTAALAVPRQVQGGFVDR